jgi:hypothetical protein
MGGTGFSVDISKLRSFSGSLQQLSDRGKELARTLSRVTADTGRADSDQMGRLGPSDVAEVVDDIATEMTDDVKLINDRAQQYEEIESQSSTTLAGLYP